MCGIFGIVSRKLPDEKSFLEALETIRHRGPDNLSTYRLKEELAFGHARLSIIDLTDASNQPFVTERSVLAYNGKIYNYREVREELERAGRRFRTKGDTEVVAQAFEEWGMQCFEKL